MPQKHLAGLNPKNGYVVRKRKMKLTRKSVLKMLAVMEASRQTSNTSQNNTNGTNPPTTESEETRPQDFLQSGRTGRRNALANILGEHAIVTSSDLPSALQGLTTRDRSDTKENEAGSSKS